MSLGVYPAITPGAITTASATTRPGSNPNVTVQNATPAAGGSGSVTYQWRRTGTNTETLYGSGASYPIGNNTSNYATAGIYYINRYAKDATCNTAWVASSGTYTLTVEGPPGTIPATKCTRCCYNGSAWADCYVSDLISTGAPWVGFFSGYISGASSDKNGKTNTAAIITNIGATSGSAAKLCNELGSGWYLPAYEELYAMSSGGAHPNSNNLPGAALLAIGTYWSSTERRNNGGRYSSGSVGDQERAVLVMQSGYMTSGKKEDNWQVRCVWRP
jgi:hypothetical protein